MSSVEDFMSSPSLRRDRRDARWHTNSAGDERSREDQTGGECSGWVEQPVSKADDGAAPSNRSCWPAPPPQRTPRHRRGRCRCWSRRKPSSRPTWMPCTSRRSRCRPTWAAVWPSARHQRGQDRDPPHRDLVRALPRTDRLERQARRVRRRHRRAGQRPRGPADQDRARVPRQGRGGPAAGGDQRRRRARSASDSK